MNTKYNEYYKTVYENLINIANNWIVDQCDLEYPLIGLNGQIVGQNPKKVKKKSDIHFQVLHTVFSVVLLFRCLKIANCKEKQISSYRMSLLPTEVFH